ncbi:MAG: threonine--tRNA ligase, partial [Candidatus Methylomirabilales bacterium]
MKEVEVILPDGSRKKLPAGASALALLQAIGLGRGCSVVAAKVDGILVDLATVPPPGSYVELVAADSPLGLQILRHSTAHLMAAAVQALFPEAKFAIGPAIENGFYYDIWLPRSLSSEDLEAIEAKMRELAAENLPFVRFEVPIEEAIALVKEQGQDFKVEILEMIKAQGVNTELKDEADPRQGMVSFYRTGPFVDLCRGPHVPNTSWLQAFKLTHLAGAYWRGDERKPM